MAPMGRNAKRSRCDRMAGLRAITRKNRKGADMTCTSTHRTRQEALGAAIAAQAWQGYVGHSLSDCGGLWLLTVRLTYPPLD